MAVLFAAGGLVYAFPAIAMGVFIGDQAVIDAGVTLLRIIAPFWAFFGGLMVVQGGFRGAGRTGVAFVLSLLSRWVFRVPVAVYLAYAVALDPVSVAPVDVNGLWWAMAASAVASFAVGVLWFHRGGWQEGVLNDEGTTAPTDGGDAVDGDESAMD